MYNIFIKREDYSYDNLLNIQQEEYGYNLPQNYLGKGVGNSPVYLNPKNNNIETQWSSLSSNGEMNIDLSSVCPEAYDGTAFYDGLGLFVTKLSSKNSLHHYAPYAICYPTVQTIYNLYTQLTFHGFIGAYHSVYNKLPINTIDKLFRYYDCPKYFSKPYFCLAEDSYKREYRKTTLDNEIVYYYDVPWVSVWKHIPMWRHNPKLELRELLRIAILKLVTDRVEFKRDLFIGVCHKHNLKKKRVLLFSYRGNKLAQMKVSPGFIQLIKNILQEYNGYTDNAYFSWFYFPIIEPIEYQKIFQRSDKRYNSLPGNLLDKVFI